MPRTTRSVSASTWSSRIVESGSTIRSALECVMSRSCHSATFSSPTWALPRRTRASPQMRSQTTGLRLCGIALEPFWPGPERLLDLAHLGALQVADLGREALQPGAGQRDGGQQLGVAVARHDLGGDRLGLQAEAFASRAPRSPGRASRTCRRRRRSRP